MTLPALGEVRFREWIEALVRRVDELFAEVKAESKREDDVEAPIRKS